MSQVDGIASEQQAVGVGLEEPGPLLRRQVGSGEPLDGLAGAGVEGTVEHVDHHVVVQDFRVVRPLAACGVDDLLKYCGIPRRQRRVPSGAVTQSGSP